MDIVVVGGGPWSPDTNFPTHHTARLLARRHRVLYLFRDSHASLLGHAAGRLPGFHSTRALLRNVVEQAPIREVAANLWVSPLAGLGAALPLSYPPVSRAVVVRAVIHHARRVLEKLGFDRPLLWFYWWFFPEIVQAIPHRLAVYDIYDDHSEYDFVRRDPRRKAYTLRQERKLLDACDLAFAVSRPLQAARAGRTPVHYLPNGVDLTWAREAVQADTPDDLHIMPRPIVGYLGSYDSRMDWDLLYSFASRRPSWSFALVGGGYNAPVQTAANVHHLGNRRYADALRYVQGFDLALIPFVHDRLTEAICPAKLFDYLALGKPVLSTPVPAIQDITGGPPIVYFGNSPADFAFNADLALREDPLLFSERQSLAAAYTWERRLDTAMDIIDDALRSRAPGS